MVVCNLQTSRYMHTHELSKRGENCKWRLELRAHQMAIEAARASNGRVQFMISRIFVLDLISKAYAI